MEDIKIVADSSSDLTELGSVPFGCAPLKVVTDARQYVDDVSLDVAKMTEELFRYKGKSSTSCPNVNDWLRAFGDAENVICFTITSSLSGSYNTACVAKKNYEEKYPSRRVEVIDTLTAGPEIYLMAQKARDLIEDGADVDEVLKTLRGYKTELLFVLESMKNLANNGRVSKIAATAAGVLGIRAIGRASDEGTLEPLTKCKGRDRALEALFGYIKEYGFKGGRVKISHCLNLPLAEALGERIKAEFANAEIVIGECRGLCSYYAEKGGMLVGFEV